MTLTPGARLGPYEILSPLGAGGMGEVWKAKDGRLDRLVAIKVLPEHLAAHPDSLARFEREARAVAALNHPNITGLFDIGEQGGTRFAVMELLEGESLRARLASGPLPPRKVIELAAQLARGLAAAHEKGVVHRDLKPDNLWITRDGRLKILDFGLAKQGHTAPKQVSQSEIATGLLEAPHRTEEGLVLGTMGYMSPEQVRGESVDARSDLFAFGAVLYEMLTARRAFARDSAADTMAAILKEEPPELESSSRPVPPGLQKVLQHCLEKDPAHRFQDAHDLAFALENLSGPDSAATLAAPFARQNRRVTWIWGGTVVVLLLAAGLLGLLAGAARREGPPRPVSIRPLTFSGHDSSPAVSPDGQILAFSSDRDGTSRIWLKQLKNGDERALTAGPDDQPRFSPDGASILFTRRTGARQTLYRISLLGEEPHVVADDATMGDWSPDGRQIAFMRMEGEDEKLTRTLMTMPAGGGTPRSLAAFGQEGYILPRWSTDGRHLALTAGVGQSGGALRSLCIVDVADGKRRAYTALAPRGTLSAVAWIDERRLVGLQSESPLAGQARVYRLDIRSGACQPLFWVDSYLQGLDLLPDGGVVFDAQSGRQNLREHRPGTQESPRWLTRGSILDRQPVFSPDGEWVAFSSDRSGHLNLWALSMKTGKVRALTDGPADDWDPAFTPDGQGLLWSSNRSGPLEIWGAKADGTGARQITADGDDAENPTQTRDGRWIVYSSGNREHRGLWKIHPDGSGAQPLVKGSTLSWPEVSPDGTHAVFRSATPGGVAIRVVRIEDGHEFPFATLPVSDRKLLTIPGRCRWTPDGRRILFTGQDALGRTGIYIQDFLPGRDTTFTRRPFAGFDEDWISESLGLSPDGTRLVLSEATRELSIRIAEGVPGLARRERR